MKKLKITSKKKKQLKRLSFIATGFCAACLATVIYCDYDVKHAAKGLIYENVAQIPARRVGLLLGTNPKGRTGAPNPYYTARIDAAAELYRSGKILRILISGANPSETYNEPEQMKADLMAQGVPDSVIYLDYAGLRTLDSVVRAKEIFGLSAFTIISQQFHNERALFLSRAEGIDAVAFNAGDFQNKWWQLRMKCREYLARTKAHIDLSMGLQPHFLGKRIEIK